MLASTWPEYGLQREECVLEDLTDNLKCMMASTWSEYGRQQEESAFDDLMVTKKFNGRNICMNNL